MGFGELRKRVAVVERNEMAKVLLDEIAGTRAQLARRGRVLMMRVDEIATGMECEECQHLWKAYQRATIESIRIDEEVRSRNEYQSFRELIERQPGLKLPSSCEWRLAKS